MRSKLLFLGALAIAFTSAQFAAGTNMVCAAGAEEMADAPSAVFKGKVMETMNASRYTYVQIDTGTEKVWAAGPVVTVKVGDSVSFSAGMPNKNFLSPTLKRKFDAIYFVEAIVTSGGTATGNPAGAPALPPGHPAIMTAAGNAASTNTAIEPIRKPDGGKSVAEIWAGKSKLSGKQVVVRAKAVKIVPNVMGMNFLHLRDGTGREGENDLVVTTKDEVQVGSVVTVRGMVKTDKDFGSGYKYAVIIENAAISRQDY